MTGDQDDDGGTDYMLKVPFVATRSHGGPYDDAAFAAGFNCGALASYLDSGAVGTFRTTVQRSLVRQADLIAMDRGWTSSEVPGLDPDLAEDWAVLELTQGSDVVQAVTGNPR